MTLKADAQGFLIGDPVDIGKAVDQLRSIRSDVSEIKRALLGTTPSNADSRSKSSSGGSNPRVNRDKPSVVNTPVRRDSGNSLGTSKQTGSSTEKVINTPGTKAKSADNVAIPVNSRKVVTPTINGRDASGRFVAKGQRDERATDQAQGSMLGGFADRIATAVKESTGGVEEADPTIKAMQEVATPMMRGYEIFAGGDKKERWFSRIFKELKSFRKDESVFNKAQAKVLKNIEAKPVSGSEDGESFIGGLLGSISPWLLTALMSIGGMLLTGIGAVLGAVFSPIGLAIGAAATVAWGLFTEEGQKFFGEIGAKIIAGWDFVVAEFAPITESISKGWDTVKGGFDNLINGMISTWDSFTGFLKDKFGIDIPGILKPVVDAGKKAIEATKETVNAGADAAKDTASKAIEAVKESSPKTTQALGNAWNKVKEGAGKIKFHATEKTNAETAMKVLMDKGWTKEQAAGIAANLASESGFDTDATGDNGKAKGIAQWHPDRQKKFEEINGKKLSDATLEEQVAFVDWELKNTEKKAGDKIRTATTAEQAAALTERHYERSALGLKGGVQPERIANASKYANLDIAEYKKPELEPKSEPPAAVASLSDDPTQGGRYKYETLDGGKVQVTDNETGVTELASDEQANAYRRQQGQAYLNKVAEINAMPSLHNLAAGPGAANQTQTAFAAAPSVPAFSPAPTPAEAPPQITPLASLDSGKNITVTMPAADVGRDVKDRRIAHIVSGGLSG